MFDNTRNVTNVVNLDKRQRSLSTGSSSERSRCTHQSLARAVAQALNALYYTENPITDMDDVALKGEKPLEESMTMTDSRTGTQFSEECIDLPLWRVQWAVLPGFQVLCCHDTTQH